VPAATIPELRATVTALTAVFDDPMMVMMVFGVVPVT